MSVIPEAPGGLRAHADISAIGSSYTIGPAWGTRRTLERTRTTLEGPANVSESARCGNGRFRRNGVGPGCGATRSAFHPWPTFDRACSDVRFGVARVVSLTRNKVWPRERFLEQRRHAASAMRRI